MAKIHALRRFLLPCFAPAAGAVTAGSNPKKRLSTSLRDSDEDDKRLQEDDESESDGAEGMIMSAPPRSSKSMVIGTIFGKRRGHVWICIQHDRVSTRPGILLELSLPVARLVKEMSLGLVRLSLECRGDDAYPLRSVPVWTVFCNGRKVGFAARRKATAQIRGFLKTMECVSVGAGVVPAGLGMEVEEDVMYMRGVYECVVGSADSESFHLLNPDELSPGQELSVFLLRTR